MAKEYVTIIETALIGLRNSNEITQADLKEIMKLFHVKLKAKTEDESNVDWCLCSDREKPKLSFDKIKMVN